MHVFSGYPGSVHDARVFTHSGLQHIINHFTPGRYILADSAYSLQEHVMVPYRRDGPRTREERYYNRILSAIRQTVERAIGLLKMGWRILYDRIPLQRIREIPFYILSCCILHNICLLSEDAELLIPMVPPPADEHGGPLEPTRAARRQGNIERDRITYLLSNPQQNDDFN